MFRSRPGAELHDVNSPRISCSFALQASTLRSGAADELVSTLRESVRGWALSTEDLFPMYRDLLQPLRCASLELLTGLELLRGESDVGISRAIAALVAFPRSLHAADLNEGSIGRVVASMGRREGVDPLDVLVSEMRLNLLRLHESVSSARRSRRRSASTSWWLPVHAVFASFVGLWQRVVEEEERIAQEEAQFIKTKALEIEMDPDEVRRWPQRNCGMRNGPKSERVSGFDLVCGLRKECVRALRRCRSCPKPLRVACDHHIPLGGL